MRCPYLMHAAGAGQRDVLGSSLELLLLPWPPGSCLPSGNRVQRNKNPKTQFAAGSSRLHHSVGNPAPGAELTPGYGCISPGAGSGKGGRKHKGQRGALMTTQTAFVARNRGHKSSGRAHTTSKAWVAATTRAGLAQRRNCPLHSQTETNLVVLQARGTELSEEQR